MPIGTYHNRASNSIAIAVPPIKRNLELMREERYSGVNPMPRTNAPGEASVSIIVTTYGMSTATLMYLGSSKEGRGW